MTKIVKKHRPGKSTASAISQGKRSQNNADTKNAVTANRPADQARQARSIVFKDLLRLVNDCESPEELNRLLKTVFGPTEPVRLDLERSELPSLVRLVVAVLAVSFQKVPLKDQQGNLKLKGGEPQEYKKVVPPQELIRYLDMSESSFQAQMKESLTELQKYITYALEDSGTQLPKYHHPDLAMRLRVPDVNNTVTPWFSGILAGSFQRLTFIGSAGKMKASFLCEIAFVLNGRNTSLVEEYFSGNDEVRKALVSAGALSEELSWKWFNCNKAVLPDAVPSDAPQVLWGMPEGKTLALTPVPSVAALSAVGSLAKSAGYRSATLRFGGANPRNCGAYANSTNGRSRVLTAFIPNVSHSAESRLGDKLFYPHSLILSSWPGFRAKHPLEGLTHFKRSSNKEKRASLSIIAETAVVELAGALLRARELVQNHAERLTSEQRAALDASTDACAAWVRDVRPQKDSVCEVAGRVANALLKEHTEVLGAEWADELETKSVYSILEASL